MQKYKVLDILTDEYIIEGAGAQEVTRRTDIGNVKYLAERGTLYKKRYLIEFDGEDDEVQELLTNQTAFNKCKRFKVGDVVTLVQKVNKGNKEIKTVKEKVKILAKYPSLILVGKGQNYKIKESFSYIDIVNQKLFIKNRR